MSQFKGSRGFFWLVTAATTILVLLGSGCKRQPRPSAARVQRVGLVYTGPHELINQIVRGFREGLATEMPRGSYEIVERHASGDPTQFATTVSAVIAQRPDLLVPVTTPISQIALREKPAGTPMVFLGVTDPVGAHLVDSVDHPGRCTGVSDLAPYEAVLQFARRIRPSATRLGLPFSPEEQPAVYGRDQILRLAPRFGFVVDARPVTSMDELPTVVRALSQTSDALLIGSDNGMFEAAPLIVRTCMDASKPVFAGDSTSIRAGALGGYTVDYTAVGREGARIAARVLRGEQPRNIPVAVMRDGVLELNSRSAARLGIAIPAEITSRAGHVYDN